MTNENPVKSNNRSTCCTIQAKTNYKIIFRAKFSTGTIYFITVNYYESVMRRTML